MVQQEKYLNVILLGGNPLFASVVLLAWQAMRQSASAIHYFPPEKCNLNRCTHSRTCVGRFCDANYMNTEGVNLIRGTKYAESWFLPASISRFVFHAEAVGDVHCVLNTIDIFDILFPIRFYFISSLIRITL